jgi:predicted HicB family RNase H-like nuclease
MTTKLTLTVEKDVIERAKCFAKSSGRSLSELIEQYLDTITQENNHQQVSPKLKTDRGS